MSNQHQNTMLLSISVVFALIIAALTPTLAFAEGEAPETPLPPPDAPLVAADTVNVPDAVQVLAENNAVLVDAGSPVPLASQTALQILCDPDPWFYGACPGGKCLGYLTIQAALDDWYANKGKGFIYVEGGYNQTQNLIIDGTVNPEYLSLSGIVWDTSTIGAKPILRGYLDVHNLTKGFTLQGLDIRYAASDSPMYLTDNSGVLKLIDVDVTTTLPGAFSFQIVNNGPVELLRVNAHNNALYGVSIDNCNWDGATCRPTGSVKITNSNFNSNGANYGLSILSGGAVILNAVSSSFNTGDGLRLQAYGPVTIRNSVFSSNSTPAVDQGYGIYIDPLSTGSILLDNVILSNNSNHGAFISTSGNVTLKKVNASYNSNKGVFIAATDSESSAAGAKNITIIDSTFQQNFAHNLWVNASGSITIKNLTSNNSIGYGVRLDNSSATKSPGVSLKNAFVTENQSLGVGIVSKGNILVDSIIIRNSTSGIGLSIVQNIPGSTGSVTLKGSLFNNLIEGNGMSGLKILTYRNVSIMNTLSRYNSGTGIEIDAEPNTGSVSLKNVSANQNGEWGVQVYTSGKIIWNKGEANSNGWTYTSVGGALIDNVFALETSPKAVSLRDVVLNDNLDNTGLTIQSRGAVSLVNITANGNDWDGVKVNIFPGAGNITLANVQADENDIIGVNVYQIPGFTHTVNVSLANILARSNGSWGIYVETNGSIAWNKGEASNNGWNPSFSGGGAFLYNLAASENASKAVNVRDVALNGNQREASLWILSHGAITITNAQMIDNIFSGLVIYKYTGVGNIKLTNVLSEGNSGGLSILSTSTIQRFNNLTLINVNANNNNSMGASIDVNGHVLWSKGGTRNNGLTSPGNSVRIKNTYTSPSVPYSVKLFNTSFSQNSNSSGVSIASYGAVTLNNVLANYNASFGVQIDNCGGSSTTTCTNAFLSPVTVINSSFNNTFMSTAGLRIRASGAVTLSNVQALFNVINGVTINNCVGSTTAKPVYVTKGNFSNNGLGLYILSDNAVTLNTITALKNGSQEGVYVNNNTSLMNSPIIMTGVNSFIANGQDGIRLVSNGLVSLSGIQSANNGYRGIYVGTKGAVTLKNSRAESNQRAGVTIFAELNVTIQNLNSFFNGWSGIDSYGLFVAIVDPSAKLTISNSSLVGNAGYGLYAEIPAPTEEHLFLNNVNLFGNLTAPMQIVH